MGEKVVAGITDDMGEETHCREHPDRTNPSGICPSCLQEKLRKLIISSKSSNPFFSKPPPPSSSSSSPVPPSSFPSSRKKKPFWSFLSLSNRRSIDHRASNDLQNHSASYGPNLSRSRSVGCGSRSFSADFFDRISNGFGDCALRRAESHRERKTKLSADEKRAKCGGIFGGLGLTHSSTYWLSASEVSADFEQLGGRSGRPRRRWGWAFASPVRAFRAKVRSSGGRSGGNCHQSVVAIGGL